ncbi:hypothetical protein [Rhodococcus opacus]|uniref:Uncharacterized protein n=1 Tax=Rhodococcus opacus TaxID=37919 RepID=A0A2S8JAR4_RHOOP|nr:hypothetical protein [Rhodococcus opacus]PQP24141.1 hypothetical protein C5613_14775 [Rhodococcus opacus]
MNITLSATVEARVLPSCEHGTRVHRTVAEFLQCALPGSVWVQDEKRQLEFPEYHNIALLWCGNAGFSLYPERSRAWDARRQGALRLCPLGFDCTGDHRTIEISGRQLAPIPGRAA